MKIAVIVGAGLATRLRPITEIIPKVLINYGQHTILKHLVDLYKEHGAQKIILILPSKHVKIVEAYLSYMKINGVSISQCDGPYGSAFAIKCIEDKIKGQNVIFNWSDIIPSFESNLTWDQDTIYTHGNECRYKFDQVAGLRNVGSTGGNVVGIYQVAKFKQLSEFLNLDFADAYDFTDFKQEQLTNIVDLGDFDKLRNEHTKIHSICRSFNKITFNNDNTISKQALDQQGIDLQKIELSWYESIAMSNTSDIKVPAVKYDELNHTITMKQINGQTLANCKGDENFESYVKTLLNGSVSREVYFKTKEEAYSDYHKEFHDKIIDRCKSIRRLIESKKVTHVNGTRIYDLPLLLELAWKDIEKSIETTYEVIHGDLNFSNVLVEDNDLYMIDPRGYFGDSKIFGPKDYDVSKILYALSGYDLFNSQCDWSGLTFEDDSSEIFIEIQPLLENWKTNPNFEYKHQVMVALIWVALAGYFKNNPYKSLASYYYGMYLLSNLYSDKIRTYKNEDNIDFFHTNLDHSITRSITTKFPAKWLLIDRETNTEYVMSLSNDEIGQQWIKRNK